MDLGNFNLNPLALALLIMGLVELVKKFGITGNKLILISMAIGMILAVFLFMRDMTKQTKVENVTIPADEDSEVDDPLAVSKFNIPKHIGEQGRFS